MENTIYNSNEEVTIGYFEDIKNGYKKLIKEATEKEDYEEVQSLIDQLDEINDWADCDDLLVLGDGNGMGLTITSYKQWEK